MPEELLDLLQRHPPFQESHGHRMAQQMRVHPRGDLGLYRGFLDKLSWMAPVLSESQYDT